ncbi:ABC transporter substrate-binding protein [Mangrovactinospora gilvigrisea]|uniref:ABC transporter substrate-binding protein n=1 Tax=Mangrovactinospora gilvigrisea TaxID=1428644 RepID=A0A1J7C0X2_9ACTN|nr:ABC transporter substrate-binding protein [Mangrovactinospora gilvigrisea]OIV35228.1 ABC transporter substrate-binding protein [Mangrovactinospora gilvigrisea]
MSPAPTTRSVANPTRRGLLAAGGAAGLGVLLAACGSGEGSGTAASNDSSGGSWELTDDRGTKVKLASRPTRLVTYIGVAAALHDFGVDEQIVGVFGPSKLKDGKPDALAGGFDVSKATVVGNVYGQFDLEKYASLRPELLVTHTYQNNALWYVPDASKDKIAKLAPSFAIKVSNVLLPEAIGRHQELAAALGADLKATKVTDAKKRFDAAAERIRKTAKARKGITVMASSAAAATLYVSSPKPYADLNWLTSLGVDFIRPDNVQGGFFENLSWEKADKYRADVILLDNRTGTLQPKDLTGKPTWQRLPAVKADQVVPWPSEARFSWAGCAPTLERIADALESAKKVA